MHCLGGERLLQEGLIPAPPCASGGGRPTLNACPTSMASLVTGNSQGWVASQGLSLLCPTLVNSDNVP